MRALEVNDLYCYGLLCPFVIADRRLELEYMGYVDYDK